MQRYAEGRHGVKRHAVGTRKDELRRAATPARKRGREPPAPSVGIARPPIDRTRAGSAVPRRCDADLHAGTPRCAENGEGARLGVPRVSERCDRLLHVDVVGLAIKNNDERERQKDDAAKEREDAPQPARLRLQVRALRAPRRELRKEVDAFQERVHDLFDCGVRLRRYKDGDEEDGDDETDEDHSVRANKTRQGGPRVACGGERG